MADVLGTIAAVTQLTDMVIKLKQLHAEIKQTPMEVLELIEEVEVLLLLVSDMQSVHTNNNISLSPTSTWKKCHELLRSSLVTLTELVRDLESVLRAHKRTGAVRTFFRKDEMQRYKQRLERAKSTMGLAQQLYSFAVLSDQQSQLLQRVQVMAVDQLGSPQIQRLALKTRTEPENDNNQQKHEASTPSLAVHNQEITITGRMHSRKYLTLNLPSWLLRTGLQILCERNNYSMKFSFRVYNTRPWKSDIIRAARRCDWSTMKQLFQDGHASPFDLNPEGATLLHYAADARQPEACKMFLDLGLDPLYRSHDGFTAVDLISPRHYVVPFEYMSSPDVETTSILINACSEPFVLQEHPMILHLIGMLDMATVSFLIQATALPYENIERSRRARAAMNVLSYNPQIIPILLGSDLSLHQAFSLLATPSQEWNHITLLRHAADRLGEIAARGIGQMLHLKIKWMDVVREIVKFESANTSQYKFGSCYLRFIFSYTVSQENPGHQSNIRDWNEHLTSIGKLWLNVLVDLGVDLTRYGRAEHSTIKHCGYEFPTWPRNYHRRCLVVRPGFLTVGAHVDDWRIFVVPSPRSHVKVEVAGAFWNWVENPELFNIPGAFIKEEEEEDEEDEEDEELEYPDYIMVTGPIF